MRHKYIENKTMKKYPIQIVTKRNGLVHQYQRNRLLSQKSITRDKGGHDIFTKVSIHQVCITIISTYTANKQLPKHTKQTLTELKGAIV